MKLFLLGSLFFFTSLSWAGGSKPPLPGLAPVQDFNLEHYLGDWYELARKPQRFQKDCFCTQARYSLNDDGTVRVLNRCRKKGPEGKLNEAEGRARFEGEDETRAALEVSFFLWFYGQYWVVDLDPDYQWAVVSNAPGSTLWVLARDPEFPQDQVEALLAKAERKGIDTSDVIRSDHAACLAYED
jgi:apolipoprotein D and lipocalin family protein